jgi:hypothetical protein
MIFAAKVSRSRTEIAGGGAFSPTFPAIPSTVFDPRSLAYVMRPLATDVSFRDVRCYCKAIRIGIRP